MTGWLLFKTVLAALACYRLSRLLAYDDAFAWLRKSVKSDTFLGRFLSCPYCLGVWFAIPLAFLVAFNHQVALLMLLMLGIAGAQDVLECAAGRE